MAGLTASYEVIKNIEDILESSFDGFYITDGDANTILLNKAYETITGLRREDLIGHNMYELEDNKAISKSATLMVLRDKTVKTIEQEFQTGKRALVSSTPIFDSEGNITMVVTNVRDLSALQLLKSQMEHSKKLTDKYRIEIEAMRLQILGTDELIAHDEKMLETLNLAKRVALVDTTVLVLGETGVGKEEVAKFIHKNSNRKEQIFIKINCGAIPENLIESELFGYEKGSFSGADKNGKLGIFEVANGGTMFLDEIGELPLEMQVRLLRVLQEKEIVRIGGLHPIKIDVRLIAATNRDLEEMVTLGHFRKDLYYRLFVVPITLLPLRERREDILPLAKYFCQELNEKYGWEKKLTGDALSLIYGHKWMGNVRELKNTIERAVVMSDSEWISSEDIQPLNNFEQEEMLIRESPEFPSLKEAVAQFEASLLERAYLRFGNVRDAAKALNIDSSTFVRKRQRFNRKNTKEE